LLLCGCTTTSTIIPTTTIPVTTFPQTTDTTADNQVKLFSAIDGGYSFYMPQDWLVIQDEPFNEDIYQTVILTDSLNTVIVQSATSEYEITMDDLEGAEEAYAAIILDNMILSVFPDAEVVTWNVEDTYGHPMIWIMFESENNGDSIFGTVYYMPSFCPGLSLNVNHWGNGNDTAVIYEMEDIIGILQTLECLNGAVTTTTEITQTTVDTSPISILSHNSYADGNYYHVIAEVRNNLQSNVEYVKITATFYDSSNYVVATDYSYTPIDILQPNQLSPVDLSTYPYTGSVDHYTLSIGGYWETTDEPYTNLITQGATTSTDSLGYYDVIGEVKNTGSSSIEYTKIIITFYDASGEIIGYDYTYANNDIILPGQTSPFSASSYPQKFQPASYSIQLQARPIS